MKTWFVITLVLLFLVGLTSNVFAKTCALLIGIDEYPGLTKKRQLSNASRNGVSLMKQMLKERFNIEIEDIDTVINREATREGIINKIKGYEGKLKSSDVLLIYYTGHGTGIISKDNDELIDQAFVCYDFGYTKRIFDDPKYRGLRVDKSNLIIDDEMGELIRRIKANNGPKVVLIADMCHSGTADRAIGGNIENPDGDEPLVGDETKDINAEEIISNATLSMGIPSFRDSEQRAGLSGKTSSDVLISACLDTQEAYAQKLIPDGYVGLLTYNLESTLNSSNRNVTYSSLGKILKSKIKDQTKRQTPRIKGRTSDLFLDFRGKTSSKSTKMAYAHGNRSGPQDITENEIFIDGFDTEDTNAIESAFDKASQFVTIMDEPGKDALVFKNKATEDYTSSGEMTVNVISGLGKSQKELWQTPPAKDAVELGSRLYCYTALGMAFRNQGTLLSSKESILEPKLTLDDSAARYASVWPTDESGFQYALQLTDDSENGIWIWFRLNVKRDCFGFIISVNHNGETDIIGPGNNNLKPLMFIAGDSEIANKSLVGNVTMKGNKIFPGRDVVAVVVFEKKETAATALTSLRQGYALPIVLKASEISYLLIDTEK